MRISRGDLILITIMALCLLLPLGARIPLLSTAEEQIELPGSRDIEVLEAMVAEGDPTNGCR